MVDYGPKPETANAELPTVSASPTVAMNVVDRGSQAKANLLAGFCAALSTPYNAYKAW